jgi:diacylglycerol kinase (ATP)
MSEDKKVLFIINKFAGTGYPHALSDFIYQAGQNYHSEVTIQFTEGPGHATEIAQNAVKAGIGSVVAVGGDGTLNEVANGLSGSATPMGIIARGSGNGLARHLCIPLTVSGAIENFFTGKAIAMDTFTMNGKLSLNVSGIGFDGHIANLFGGKTKRGLTGYARLTLREFIRFPEFKSTITLGKEKIQRNAFVLAIANSSQYGNNACIAPTASVCDGILHLNILKKIPPYRFDFVYAFFNKTIDRSRFSEIKESTDILIETDHPVPYHVDGEPGGKHSVFDIKIKPAALHIIVPAKAAPGSRL